MEIMVPVSPSAASARLPKKRLRDIRGARVALLDDNLDTPFTTHLETLLADRHGVQVKRFVKPSQAAPSPKTLINEVAGYQAAIVGIAL